MELGSNQPGSRGVSSHVCEVPKTTRKSGQPHAVPGDRPIPASAFPKTATLKRQCLSTWGPPKGLIFLHREAWTDPGWSTNTIRDLASAWKIRDSGLKKKKRVAFLERSWENYLPRQNRERKKSRWKRRVGWTSARHR